MYPHVVIKKNIFLLFTVFSLLAVSACTTVQEHLDTMLNEYSCRQDMDPVVGPDREAILYVRHHIFVGDSPVGDNTWNPEGFTFTPEEIICWENRRIVFYRNLVIQRLMDDLNQLLYDNDMHLYLVTDSIDIQVDENIFPADFDLLSTPIGRGNQLMRKVVHEQPGYLHLLWGWTSDTPTMAAGRDGAVLIADNPRGGETITVKIAAREILHALGYYPLDTLPHQLMHYEGTGLSIGSQGIRAVWELINNRTPRLHSLSCDPLSDLP